MVRAGRYGRPEEVASLVRYLALDPGAACEEHCLLACLLACLLPYNCLLHALSVGHCRPGWLVKHAFHPSLLLTRTAAPMESKAVWSSSRGLHIAPRCSQDLDMACC
jgi:hypothetical protein